MVVCKERNIAELYGRETVLSVSGEYGIVNQISFQGRSFSGSCLKNYKVVKKGAVVYTKSPLKTKPYGIIKTNQGDTGIVSTLYAVYLSKKSLIPEFIQYYFELDSRLNNYLRPLVNKGAKNDMKVADQKVLSGVVIVPSFKEQEYISELFLSLDSVITLHQR